MCCFTRNVDVDDTRIFVRATTKDRQVVVYAMRMKAQEEGAMVLPLPVPKEVDEKSLRFFDLSAYAHFFADLARGFPRREALARNEAAGADSPEQALEVVAVGSFDASFVPTVADFARLDERFRLPEDVFAKLPQYAGYGFAVFRLRPGEVEVHPMAFEFPRREPRRLFFPTVHVHDGEVHPTAHFDHTLYCQPGTLQLGDLVHWRESGRPAATFVDIEKAKELVLAEQHCYQREVRGVRPNEDLEVA